MSDESTTEEKLYLNEDFGLELKNKIWITKGVRFTASERLKSSNRLSSNSIALLSAYLIILGLLSIYKIGPVLIISTNEFAFISTCLSILILLFSQIENSNDYKLRAEKFHNCALEINELYSKLRIIETEKHISNLEDNHKHLLEISNEYYSILKKYENHLILDFEIFKLNDSNPSIFKNLPLRVKNFIYTRLLYYILIFLPPILIILLISYNRLSFN